MTRDRGYPDWLVLSARLLAQPSCGQVTIVQNRCLIMFPCGYVKILQPVAICTVIFVTFPPWSSQMTIILITNAMYHIRYKNSEYEFKRKNPHGLITAKHQQSPTNNGKPPTIQEETIAFLKWNGIHLGVSRRIHGP